MFNFSKKSRLSVLISIALFTLVTTFSLRGQEIVDKTVAVVTAGQRSELITYSDIIWQLALQPGLPLDPPRPDDLDRALQLLIDQRIFALEAERLPRPPVTDREIADKITETLGYFSSPAAFEMRLKQVGFDSIRDEAFVRLIAQRLSIEKYIEFRFGSFVVITPDDEAKYYRDIFVPDFQRKYRGVLVPAIDEKRVEIRQTLTRQKVATAIERFLDEAKRRVVIEILIDV